MGAQNSSFGDGIDIGGFDGRRTGTAQIAIAHIISENEEEIGLLLGEKKGAGKEEKKKGLHWEELGAANKAVTKKLAEKEKPIPSVGEFAHKFSHKTNFSIPLPLSHELKSVVRLKDFGQILPTIRRLEIKDMKVKGDEICVEHL